MTKQEFIKLFEEIVEEPPGTLHGDEQLREQLAGWNSLAILSFIALADEHCGLTLSPKAISGCKTVNDLMALLGDQVKDGS